MKVKSVTSKYNPLPVSIILIASHSVFPSGWRPSFEALATEFCFYNGKFAKIIENIRKITLNLPDKFRFRFNGKYNLAFILQTKYC